MPRQGYGNTPGPRVSQKRKRQQSPPLPTASTQAQKRSRSPEPPPRRPSPEIQTGIAPGHPPARGGRSHARGRFAPPAILAPPTHVSVVRGEHAHDKPFTDWLNHRFFNPDPHDEVRVLGMAGAKELDDSRQRFRNAIYNMHAPQLHAGENTRKPSEAEIAKVYAQQAGIEPLLEQAPSDRGVASAVAGVTEIDTGRIGDMLNHPLRAFHSHQEQQHKLGQLYEDAKRRGMSDDEAMHYVQQTGAELGIPTESIGIIPWVSKGAKAASKAESVFTRALKRGTRVPKDVPPAPEPLAPETTPERLMRHYQEGQITQEEFTQKMMAEAEKPYQVKYQPKQKVTLVNGQKATVREDLGRTVRAKVHGEPERNIPKNEIKVITPQEQVLQKLPEHSALQGPEDELRRIERGKRAGAALQAASETGGEAGLAAAKQELRGALPALSAKALRGEMDAEDVNTLYDNIWFHDKLQNFEKVNTAEALDKVLNGTKLQPSEKIYLRTAFGPKVANELMQAGPLHRKILDNVESIINIPRSLMASFDVSAPFRQGLVAFAGHPAISARNIGPMLKMFGSERVYQASQREITSRATYSLMQRAKLPLTDIDASFAHQDEIFMNKITNKVPGIRHSSRAYVGYLNRVRADVFDSLLQDAARAGRDVHAPEELPLLKSMARYVGTATGRGDLGRFNNAAVHLNQVFFSPRLFFSRTNLINPVYYYHLDPLVRRQAAKSMVNLTGALGTVLTLAYYAGKHYGGIEVGRNPLSADFAKIKIGNTRIDLLGGFQQPIRVMTQILAGRQVSSTTGQTIKLSGGQKSSPWSVLEKFLRGKASPPAGFIYDAMNRTDYQNQPFKLKKELTSMIYPILWQDVVQVEKDRHSVPLAVGAYALGATGVGIQTYGPTLQRQIGKAEKKLMADSKQYNLGQPSPEVVKELGYHTELLERTRYVKTWGERAQIAAEIFARIHGPSALTNNVDKLGSEAEAHAYYEALRKSLYPNYTGWERIVHAYKRAQEASTPAGG